MAAGRIYLADDDQLIVKMPLRTRGETILDLTDWLAVKYFNWRSHPCGYATVQKRTDGNRRHVLLHREILGFPSGDVDHINRWKTDNRRQNLRPVTRSQNCLNRSAKRAFLYKGVTRANPRLSTERWRARVWNGSKLVAVGTFSTAHEAAEAYDKAAFNLWGEFAVLNFPKGAR